jgi:hypothetical protein
MPRHPLIHARNNEWSLKQQQQQQKGSDKKHRVVLQFRNYVVHFRQVLSTLFSPSFFPK